MVITRPIVEGIGPAKPGAKTNNITTNALKSVGIEWGCTLQNSPKCYSIESIDSLPSALSLSGLTNPMFHPPIMGDKIDKEQRDQSPQSLPVNLDPYL